MLGFGADSTAGTSRTMTCCGFGTTDPSDFDR